MAYLVDRLSTMAQIQWSLNGIKQQGELYSTAYFPIVV